MPAAGDVLESPGGLRLRLLVTAAESDGALLAMEASYRGDGPLPPPHLHPLQAERFVVESGSMLTVVDGVERVLGPGDVLDVPAGAVHQMAAQAPSVVRWEVRPALRTAEVFERLYAGPGSGEDAGAFYAALLREYADELRLA